MAKLIRKGGKGSGNWGHKGRPGKVGGSAPRGDGEQQRLMIDNTPYGGLYPMSQRYVARVGEETDTAANFYSERISNLYDKYNPDYSSGVNMAGKAKNDVVTYLSEHTGVDYDVVNKIIRQWAVGSNYGIDSYFIQAHIAKVFGDKFGTDLSDWQKRRMGNTLGVGERELVDFLDENQSLIPNMKYENPGEVMDNILVEMYNRTQRQLESAGVDDVSLFRGVYGYTLDKGSVVSMDENAIESWSAAHHVADNFSGGGIVLQSNVPRERILCTPFSGFGCLAEHEFVVIGANIPDKNGNIIPDEALVTDI